MNLCGCVFQCGGRVWNSCCPLSWMETIVFVTVPQHEQTTRAHDWSLQVHVNTYLYNWKKNLFFNKFKHCGFCFSFSHCVEYAQPLVSGTMASLGQRSTFKPEEGDDPEYDAPIPPEHYHAYAEPLPASGVEYATPIMIDRANHLSGGTLPFRGRGLLARTDSSQSSNSVYDTPKSTSDQATPTEGQLYQVPQNTHNAPCQKTDWPITNRGEGTLSETLSWTLP